AWLARAPPPPPRPSLAPPLAKAAVEDRLDIFHREVGSVTTMLPGPETKPEVTTPPAETVATPRVTVPKSAVARSVTVREPDPEPLLRMIGFDAAAIVLLIPVTVKLGKPMTAGLLMTLALAPGLSTSRPPDSTRITPSAV